MKMPAGPGGVDLATRGDWFGLVSPTRFSTGEIARALTKARRENFRRPMTSCFLSLITGHSSLVTVRVRFVQPRLEEFEVALHRFERMLLFGGGRRPRDVVFEVQGDRTVKAGASQRLEIVLPVDHALAERAVLIDPALRGFLPVEVF